MKSLELVDRCGDSIDVEEGSDARTGIVELDVTITEQYLTATVFLSVDQVKRLRKRLKQWLKDHDA